LSARSVQSFSLRTKLLVFAAALVLVPGAIYGAITVASSRAALTHVVGRQLVVEARNAADRLAITLRSELSRLESFAAQDVMREIRTGDFDKRISSFLASAKRGSPACVDLLVVDRDDRAVASSDPAWIGRSLRATLGDRGEGPSIEGPLATAAADAPVLRFTMTVPEPEAPRARLGRLVAHLDWEREMEVISRAEASA
jgi:two-component system, NtrC family, sensor histidine kinase HydH